MKFLHAADIHLDSPLTGLARRAAIPAHVTRDCTRRAFANLIDLAVSEDVAFVLIAGDLYDADWRDYGTGLFFASEMRKLGRPCILIRGNHDAASKLSMARLQPPPNVRILSARAPESFHLPQLGVVVHGQSFANRAVPEDLSAAYPAPVAGALNIGLLHTSAEEPGEHETYAPCRVSALAGKGYDYWALGHIHQRRVLHERPWVVFPGNIQGRHARETGAKGCTIVDTRDGKITGITHRDLDVLRWSHLALDAAGAATMAELTALLRLSFNAECDNAGARPLIVRVTISGATALDARLRGDPAAVEAECRAAAEAVSGDVHVEQVAVRTVPAGGHALGMDQTEAGHDVLARLAREFAASIDDPETIADLLSGIEALSGHIPRLAGRPAPSLPSDAARLRDLVGDAWRAVAMELVGRPRA